VLAREENGSKFVFFIGDKEQRNPMCSPIEKIFSMGHETNYDLIDFNTLVENDRDETSRFAMIIRNKCDPAKLTIRYRSSAKNMYFDPEY
jgi:hypothetical protein